jgi:hypothetical protein
VQWHITLKEIVAVHSDIAVYQDDLRDSMVCLWEDNQAVVHIILNKTSRSPALMGELRGLMEVLESLNITIGKRDAGGMSEDKDSCFSTMVLGAFSTGVFQHHCITPH